MIVCYHDNQGLFAFFLYLLIYIEIYIYKTYYMNSVRYDEIFHESKASEISRNIPRKTSIISDLFSDGKCARAVEH